MGPERVVFGITWFVCILFFHPSYSDYIYVGVSDCLVLACAKVLGIL